MKGILNIVLSAIMVLSICSCKENSVLTETLDITTSGAALRSLVETNNLDLSDVGSTYSHLFEIQDEEFGDLVAQVNVYVGFSDDAATNDDPANSVTPSLFTSLDRSVFTVQNSQTTHDLPEGTFSTTLGDVLTFMNLDLATQVTRGDVVNFNFEIVTNDNPPRIFNSSNVGPNTGATGRFAFFNSPFDYRAAIDDVNRVVLSSVAVDDSDGSVRDGQVDTVFLSFDQELITLPTIARTSAVSATDDAIGAVTQLEGGEYFFLYTAGASATDTITFALTGAESVDGFEMASVTSSDAYIIDNVAPTATFTTGLVTVTGSNISSISVEVAFPEVVFGEVTYTITSAQFDTVTITNDVGDEAEEDSFSFTPANGTASVAAGTVTFTVTASGTAGSEGVDLAGNAIASAIPVTL